MTGDFIFLAPLARGFTGGGPDPVIEGPCKKRLEEFAVRLGDEINLIVVSDEICDCKNKIASIEEHYDFATIDPGRILVRKRVVQHMEEVDFAGLCRLFLQEEVFAVFERYPGKEPDHAYPYIKKQEGTFRTALSEYSGILAMIQEKYGEILPFYQNLLIKELYPLFLCSGQDDMEGLKQIISQIDDDIICGCGCVPEDILLRILSFKHGTDIEKKFVYRSGKLKFDNLPVIPLKEIPFVIDEMKCVKGKFNICGNVMIPLSGEEIEYFFMDNKNKKHAIEFEEGEEVMFLGERLHTRKRFRACLKVGNKPAGLRFMYRYKEMYNARVRMEFDEKIGIEPDTRRNFTIQDGYYLKAEKRILFAAPLRLQTRIKLFFTFPRKSIKMYLCK